MSDSLITKKALASALKTLMEKKGFEKITVSDIAEECGLNRQTFYYHFQDKYDLVNWVFYNDVVVRVLHHDPYENWSDVMLDVLGIMQQNRSFYIRAFNTSGQNTFQDYFFSVTKDLLLEIIEDTVAGVRARDGLDEEDENYLAEFCAYGLVGLTMQWARNGMKESPPQIVERLGKFFDGSGQTALSYVFRKPLQQAGEKPGG